MELDFTAQPGAARRATRVWTYARYEFITLIRNGEQVLLTLIIPIALMFGLTFFGSRLDVARTSVFPNVLAIAIIATSFTSLAINTAFERRSASLQLLATTPLSATNLLAGKAIAVALFELIQFAILAAISLALGLGGFVLFPVVLVVLLGTASFAALGFFIAGVLRAEAVLAVANGVFLFFLVASGLTVPLSAFGDTWAQVMAFTPATALAQSLQHAVDGYLDLAAVAVLMTWGVVAALGAKATFRWDS